MKHPSVKAMSCIARTALFSLISFTVNAQEPIGNLSEALQMSLYFYDAEKSGASRTLNRQPLEWRGDSEPSDAAVPLIYDLEKGTNLPANFIEQYRDILDPDGDGTVDLSGGFHDAGDHVKFGLPQSYSASTVAWGVYEFEDAFKKAGAYDHAMDELYWFTDYFLRSTFRNSNDEVIAFNYMVGRGGMDHTYWGPPELQEPERYPRPATFAFEDEPGSDQAAGASAALTIMSMLTKESNPEYSERCLDNAAALYRFAVNYRGIGNGDGFYPSSSDEDDLSWAAVWLYIATQEQHYLDDIVATDSRGNNIGYIGSIIPGPEDDWNNTWVHSWDTVWGGVFAKLAPASQDAVSEELNSKYWYYFLWNAEYWAGGAVTHENPNDGHFLTPSPAGFAVLTTWGSARYNAAAQLCALVYRKYAGDNTKSIGLTDWALSQMNYIMGDNPLEKSFIVGFSDNYVQHPHHRAAHGGDGTNSALSPPEHRHVLWGALAGGPDNSDTHNDATEDYVYNEVAIDYNAAFVGALAGLMHYYGEEQDIIDWAPPPESPAKEFYTTAMFEQEDSRSSQLTVRLYSFTSQPPRYATTLSARYYFSIAELFEWNQGIDDFSFDVYYDESRMKSQGVNVTGPHAVDAESGLYYVNIDWSDIPIFGTRDIQFALISGIDATWQFRADASNDYSRQDMTREHEETPRIPVYDNGVLVWGKEPIFGGSASSNSSSSSSSSSRSYSSTRSSSSSSSINSSSLSSNSSPNSSSSSSSSSSSTSSSSSSAGGITGNCSFEYVVANEWNTGFVAIIRVTNESNSNVSAWEASWQYSGSDAILSHWNATVKGTNPFSATGLNWNNSIPAGQSVEFGVQGSLANSTAEVPTVSGVCH